MIAPETTDGSAGASQRHLMRRATTVGLLMRHCANVLIAAVDLLDLPGGIGSSGGWLLAAFGLWSLYRIGTRSQGCASLAVDYLLVVGVCLAIPLLTAGSDIATRNTAPVAIAGTSVIGFAIVLQARITLAMTMGVAAAFAIGCANSVGWAQVRDIFNLYYFAIQWMTIALIRLLLLRVAAAVDEARRRRQSVELDQQVDSAVRRYEREQLALLHDTAASTLLMVGQGATMPPRRVAAQARHDLSLLREKPWVPAAHRIELVRALQQSADLLSTPVEFTGLGALWIDGEAGACVIAASREAMNNVDRHSGASLLMITVSSEAIMLADNGIGFDPRTPTLGHGITESIAGRMRRAGGSADIDSAPGSGTRVLLSWAAARDPDEPPRTSDPDRLILRSRVRYGLALTAYAAVNVVVMAPYAVLHGDHPAAQIALAAVALLATVGAVPGVRHHDWRARTPAVLALLLITVAQPLLLPLNEIGSQHYWAQGAIGWCLLPLMLELSVPTGAGVLLLAWLLGAAVEAVRAPSAAHWVNIGLGTASILGVQLFALAFNALMRDAAADAQAETEARHGVEKRQRVGEALRAEYQNRYATLMHGVEPLLDELSRGLSADDDLRRRARGQSRQLRVLFDQVAVFDHPLMRQLRPLTDAAAGRGVDTAVDVIGELPDLSVAEIAGLLAPLAQVLEATTAAAKVVLTSAAGEVSASIVGEQISDVEQLSGRLAQCADETDLVVSDGAVWLLVRHRLPDHSAVAATA